MRLALLLILSLLAPGCGKGPLISRPLPPGTQFAWQKDEALALDMARSSGRKLIVDFSANWCAPCLEMDRQTFSDPTVKAELDAKFVGFRADVSEQNKGDVALQERYKVRTLPQIIVLSPEGKELLRLRDFVPPVEFLDQLKAL